MRGMPLALGFSSVPGARDCNIRDITMVKFARLIPNAGSLLELVFVHEPLTYQVAVAGDLFRKIGFGHPINAQKEKHVWSDVFDHGTNPFLRSSGRSLSVYRRGNSGDGIGADLEVGLG